MDFPTCVVRLFPLRAARDTSALTRLAGALDMTAATTSDRFRITLGQLNPTMGDIAGNAAKARTAWEAGRDAGADLVALPEMFILGYNSQDLVMKPAVQAACLAAIEALAVKCAHGPA